MAALIPTEREVEQIVQEWTNHGKARKKDCRLWFYYLQRETFRNYRIPRKNAICCSHLDIEPCAECWIP